MSMDTERGSILSFKQNAKLLHSGYCGCYEKCVRYVNTIVLLHDTFGQVVITQDDTSKVGLVPGEERRKCAKSRFSCRETAVITQGGERESAAIARAETEYGSHGTWSAAIARVETEYIASN